MLGSALIPAALLLIGGILLPESPRYLRSKGDERNAFKVLTLIRKDVDQTRVQLELDEIKEVAAQDTPRVVCANCSVSLVRRWWPPSVSCCSSSSWASTRDLLPAAGVHQGL